MKGVPHASLGRSLVTLLGSFGSHVGSLGPFGDPLATHGLQDQDGAKISQETCKIILKGHVWQKHTVIVIITGVATVLIRPPSPQFRPAIMVGVAPPSDSLRQSSRTVKE